MKNNKIQVATMTFHMAHNYGAMLQAYALEKAVNEMGASCCVLDYRFPYIDQWSGYHNSKEILQEYGIRGLKRIVNRILKGTKKKISERRRKFDRFMRDELNLSKKVYFSKKELYKSKYDIVLFGSDQIWNPKLTDGFASEYVGETFDSDKTKLIAYGASCGTDFISQEYKDMFLPLLKRFQALGIREEGLANFIKEEYKLNAETVLDPVFLLDKSKWGKLADKAEVKIEEPYLLVYAFQTGNEIYKLAERIAKEKNLKLVTISYERNESLKNALQLTNCGPTDFLSLIRDAQFVCTTSFHGMAFSIIFQKDFYCFGHPEYSHRNADLLKRINIEERMFADEKEIEFISGCNYSYPELKELIDNSKEFLKKNIFSSNEVSL